ncbi:Creatinase/aminopeptidase [Atractiella rhizophila]|nr:Creatinase/aminopeptidase [Atractiella rhizophila]
MSLSMLPGYSSSLLTQLRESMQEHKIDAYVVPSSDAHGSEYVAEADTRRAFLSGFTGSAGTAIVTAASANLFTDGRYWIQASKQLSSDWELVKVGSPNVPNWDEWLEKNAQRKRVGIDPKLFDYGTIKGLLSKGITLVTISSNLIDPIWTDQPGRSTYPLLIQGLEYSGESASSKLPTVTSYIRSFPSPSSHFILSSLPDIAWLLNLRGKDVDYNPVFASYLLIGADGHTTLFVDRSKITPEVAAYLEETKVAVKGYEDVWETLAGLELGGRKVLGSSEISWALVEAIGEDNLSLVPDPSPVVAARGIKNPVEIEGFRKGYLRDSVAWARWAAKLERAIKGGEEVNEWEAGNRLTVERERMELYMGLAYPNISASNENAALPHYQPAKEGSRIVDRQTPYLNDSGAQYRDTTIDTTRTVHFGRPTREQKWAFTRVLQGHIAIDSAIFPEGTTGHQLDSWARSGLWKDRADYTHGSGHGFGSYLNVHEGPQGFTVKSRGRYESPALKVGHPMTNEPGYYVEGSYGVRIESSLVVKEVKTDKAGRKWLGFERFTMVPINPKLVDFSLLTREEAVWLLEHNKLCLEKVLPHLRDDKLAKAWLKRQTKFPLLWSWRCK